MDEDKILLTVVLLLAIAFRGYALIEINTFYHADEVYQFLEQAYKLAFGYGMTPWEYRIGVRSFFYPIILGAVFKTVAALGFDRPSELIFSARTLDSVFSLALVYVTYVMGRDFYSKRVGVVAAFFSAASVSLIVSSPAVFSEIASMFFSTAGVYLIYMGFNADDGKKSVLAGILIGVSFMFRFASAVFLAPVFLFLLWFKKKRVLGLFASGFMLVVLLQGLLDYVTWGSFLASARKYFMFNVVEKGSSLFGTQAYYFYVAILLMDLIPLSFVVYSLTRRRETVYLYLTAGFYFIVFSLIPHKEQRFLLPMLPLYHVIGASGVGVVVGRLKDEYQRPFTYLVLLITVLFGLFALQFQNWVYFSPELSALEFVGMQNDSTGLATSVHWSAYTTVGKNITLISLPTPLTCEGAPVVMAEAGGDADAVGGLFTVEVNGLTNPKVNYAIVCEPQLDFFREKLEASKFKRIREFKKKVGVYKRTRVEGVLWKP